MQQFLRGSPGPRPPAAVLPLFFPPLLLLLLLLLLLRARALRARTVRHRAPRRDPPTPSHPPPPAGNPPAPRRGSAPDTCRGERGAGGSARLGRAGGGHPGGTGTGSGGRGRGALLGRTPPRRAEEVTGRRRRHHGSRSPTGTGGTAGSRRGAGRAGVPRYPVGESQTPPRTLVAGNPRHVPGEPDTPRSGRSSEAAGTEPRPVSPRGLPRRTAAALTADGDGTGHGATRRDARGHAAGPAPIPAPRAGPHGPGQRSELSAASLYCGRAQPSGLLAMQGSPGTRQRRAPCSRSANHCCCPPDR